MCATGRTGGTTRDQAKMDFVVPLHPEDLEYQKPDRLYVRSVLDVENCPDIDGVIDGELGGKTERCTSFGANSSG